MVLEENWGISMARARAFFASQEDVLEAEDGFLFETCRISLTELPPSFLGAIPIPRTQLSIEGPEEAVKAIHRRFFLEFLSAGG